MAAKDELGRAGEQRAVHYLESIGYRVLDRNWRCDKGEIDVVARTGRQLAVVEVKTRRTTLYGHPFEAVDARKRRRLWGLGVAWIAAHPDAARGLELRVEVVGIVGDDPWSGTIEHLEDVVR